MVLPTEQTIEVEGVTYTLSKLDIRLYQEFLEWSKSVLPDPFEGLAKRIKDLPLELQKMAFEKAEAKAELRGTFNDPDAQKLLTTLEGSKKIFHLLFRKHHPQLTQDQVADILERGLRQHGEDFLSRLFNEGDGETSGQSG